MTENAPQAKTIDQLSLDELYTILAMIEQQHDLIFSVWSKQDIQTIFTEEGMNEEGAKMIADAFWSEPAKERFAEYINNRKLILDYHKKTSEKE